MNNKIILDMKAMMGWIEKAGQEAKVWVNNPNQWTTAAVTERNCMKRLFIGSVYLQRGTRVYMRGLYGKLI